MKVRFVVVKKYKFKVTNEKPLFYSMVIMAQFYDNQLSKKIY
jgi:hypothetical protein